MEMYLEDEFDAQDLQKFADEVTASRPGEESLVHVVMTYFYTDQLSIDGARRYLEDAKQRGGEPANR